MDSIDVSSAVQTVVGRMETNPSEFFNDAYRWRFVFNEIFLNVLTDEEKTTLNEAMIRVRRAEFSNLVLHAALSDATRDVLTTVSGAKYNPTQQAQNSVLAQQAHSMGVAAQYNTAKNAAIAQQYNNNLSAQLQNAGIAAAQSAGIHEIETYKNPFK